MTPAERHRRVTRIFIAVCSLDEEEQRKALDRLCRNREDLRREVELLLSYHRRAAEGASRRGSPSPRF